MIAVAHANDGGGSIRIPASECGLVGLKPTRGRTSFGPDVGDALFGLVAEGVVSRSVRDTAAVLDAIAGVMPGDPYTAPPPSRPFLQEVGADPGKLRIGVLTRAPGEQFTVHPECVAAAERAGKLLESLGHHVEAGHPMALDEHEVGQHFSTMYATNAARLVEVLSLFCGRELGPEDFDNFNWTLAGLGRGCSATQLIATIEWLHGFTRRMASWWEGGFDLLLTPTLTLPPPPLGYFDAAKEDPMLVGMKASQFAAYTLPFNITGRPAISLPLHWTPEGLPVGVQLVADYAREDLLLRVAARIETAAPWASRRPPVHA
jgi:amidase